MVEITWSFLIATFVLMFKPGPHMLTFMSLAAGGYYKRMVAFFFGYEAGSAILYIFALKTLSLLPAGFGMIFIFLKAIAALLFVHMGISGLRERIEGYRKDAAETKEKLTSKESISAGTSGFTLGLANPYEIVYIITVLPTLLDKTSFTVLEILFVFAVIVLIGLISTIIYTAPIIATRQFLSGKFLDYLRVVSSLAMIAIGLYLLVNLIWQWDLETANLISGVVEHLKLV